MSIWKIFGWGDEASPVRDSYQRGMDFKGERPTEEEIEKLDNVSLGPFDKCPSCDEYWIDLLRQNRYNVDDSVYSNKINATICYGCYEHDRDYMNTVVIYDPKEGKVTKFRVGDHIDMEFEVAEGLGPEDDIEDISRAEFVGEDETSPIQFEYHSTDAWRGYHSPVVPEGWTEVHSDAILAGSGDADELEKFDSDVRQLLWKSGVRFATCFGMTSNLFSTGYDVIAEIPESLIESLKIVSRVMGLRAKYRSRERFMRTALTGDSEETLQGRRMVKAYDMITDNPEASAMEIAKAVVEEVPA